MLYNLLVPFSQDISLLNVFRYITFRSAGALIFALLFTIIYYFGGEGFLRLLSDDSDVIAASRDYALWAVTIPFAGFAAFVWDGVYIGATLSRQLLISMAISAATFFLIYFLLFSRWGNHALWLAFITYLALRGILQALLFRRAYPRKQTDL